MTKSLADGAAPTLSRRPHPADPLADLSHSLNLSLDVREHAAIAVAPQALVDEGPKHHLEADRTHEFDHRLAGKHPGTIEDCLGNHKQDSGLVREHCTSQGPAGDDSAIAARFVLFQTRSEEHTSELQSPCNLVCRLLLE